MHKFSNHWQSVEKSDWKSKDPLEKQKGKRSMGPISYVFRQGPFLFILIPKRAVQSTIKVQVQVPTNYSKPFPQLIFSEGSKS